MIQHKSHIFLVFLIAFNNYIIFPQLTPKFSMALDKFVLPNRNSPFNNANGLILRILVMNTWNQGRNNSKMILLTFGNIHFHFQKM